MRICFVAAPLVARSGVYNSTLEAVAVARSRGMDWTAVVGVSKEAAGTPSEADGIYEIETEPGGLGGVRSLAKRLQDLAPVQNADVVISMIPQSDMALSLTSLTWIAYLRGLPWPAAGESSWAKAAVWRMLEVLALRRAKDVWATTPTLAREVGGTVKRIVPPGLTPPEIGAGGGVQKKFVWAARYGQDKNPGLFLDTLQALPTASGVMYGTGPLQEDMTRNAPANVVVAGWATRAHIWNDALAYVGTSTREAFGRSAVEAAMLGIPVVVSDQFGCAEMLFTDAELRSLCVLPTGGSSAWVSTLARIASDSTLRTRIAEHVKMNAAELTTASAVDNIDSAASDAISSVR